MYYAIFYQRNSNGEIHQLLGSDGVYKVDGRKSITSQQKDALNRAKLLINFGIPIIGFELVKRMDRRDKTYSSNVPLSEYDEKGLIFTEREV